MRSWPRRSFVLNTENQESGVVHKMNNLELAICKAVKRASGICMNITGHGLYDAPESLFQSLVGTSIGDSWYVLFEASRSKIGLYHERSLLGRPPKRKTKYDLVVWNRARDTLRAVIELKRGVVMTESMRRDAERIRQAMTRQYQASSGYLLIYSTIETANGASTLRLRMDRWADNLGLDIICQDVIKDEHTASGWVEAFALMRA